MREASPTEGTTFLDGFWTHRAPSGRRDCLDVADGPGAHILCTGGHCRGSRRRGCVLRARDGGAVGGAVC